MYGVLLNYGVVRSSFVVDWDKAADDLKKKGVVEIDLWGWPLLNSCIMIRDALRRRGFGVNDISMDILDTLFDEKVKVTLRPKVKKGRS